MTGLELCAQIWSGSGSDWFSSLRHLILAGRSVHMGNSKGIQANGQAVRPTIYGLFAVSMSKSLTAHARKHEVEDSTDLVAVKGVQDGKIISRGIPWIPRSSKTCAWRHHGCSTFKTVRSLEVPPGLTLHGPGVNQKPFVWRNRSCQFAAGAGSDGTGSGVGISNSTVDTHSSTCVAI